MAVAGTLAGVVAAVVISSLIHGHLVVQFLVIGICAAVLIKMVRW